MIAPPPKSGGPLLRIILFLLMTLPTFAKDPCPPLKEPGHFRTCQRWAFTQLHVEARKTYRAEVEFHDVVDGIRFPIKVDDLHGWPDLFPRILAAPLFWSRRRWFQPWFSLIGTVDKQHPFRLRPGQLPAGAQPREHVHWSEEFVAPASGELVCYFNDAFWAYGNNQGSVVLRLHPVAPRK